MKRKTIRLDQDTMEMLEFIDKKHNLLKPNHNAVIKEAIIRMYYSEQLKDLKQFLTFEEILEQLVDKKIL